MLFNSYTFILYFFPIVLLANVYLRIFFDSKYNNIFLILSSILFYAYPNPHDLWIIIISVIFNYFLARWLAQLKTYKFVVLTVAVSANLTLLIFYKYSVFFQDLYNQLSGSELRLFHKRTLPLAISFFTFQQISFVVDIYRAKSVKIFGFIEYTSAVLFFPHLIAGPLVEYKKLIPQFCRRPISSVVLSSVVTGMFLLIVGFVKKIVIADNLAPLVDLAFVSAQSAASLSALATLISVISYTLQLYFDFSGYSDMAVGLALMLGFRLPFNFNSPYKAKSIIDFWRRWHISLSVFLRNYLYIPLGGNRNGQYNTLRNLFLTMLLGGIWHGAGFGFVIWGAWHGVLLCLNHLWRNLSKNIEILSVPHFTYFKWPITLVSVALGWVFFRAVNVEHAITILKKLANVSEWNVSWVQSFPVDGNEMSLFVLLGSGFLAMFAPNSFWILKQVRKFQIFSTAKSIYLLAGIVLAILFQMCLIFMSKPQTFQYYQF